MTFGILASFTLVSALGLTLEKYFGHNSLLAFKVILTILHSFVVIYISVYTIYLGNRIQWKKHERGTRKETKMLSRKDIPTICCIIPNLRVWARPPTTSMFHRYIFVSLFITVNVYVMVRVFQDDLAHTILKFLIANLGLYFGYYCFMKGWQYELRQCGWRVFQPIIYLCLSGIFGYFAVDFFIIDLTEWNKAAAESREGNGDCVWMNFYDEHDVWHFLSGLSIFFLYMTLLSLDDALQKNDQAELLLF